ncbi:transcription antitermination factor NusB [Siminovitchia sediminis]|uniref:Transcription antitermination protein NusB n=1 Tax=Siminovitchia sediminis TaxID=1274353 RepID=A0ABW4KIL8_9BACI
MKRREAREKALQALFQIDMSKIEPSEALENVLSDGQSDDFLQQLIEGTCAHLSEIDDTISTHLERWSIDRLGKVDVNVLRIATYELKFTETPPNVVINEAVEVAKIYGDEKSGSFVNGILSKINGEKSD